MRTVGLTQLLTLTWIALHLAAPAAAEDSVPQFPEDFRYKGAAEAAASGDETDSEWNPKTLDETATAEVLALRASLESENLEGLNFAFGTGVPFFDMDDVFMDAFTDNFVMLKLDLEPEESRHLGVVHSFDLQEDGYLFHGKTPSGLGYALYFRGWDPAQVEEMTHKLQKRIADASNPGSLRQIARRAARDLWIPSAHALSWPWNWGKKQAQRRTAQIPAYPTEYTATGCPIPRAEVVSRPNQYALETAGRAARKNSLGAIWQTVGNCFLKGVPKGVLKAVNPVEWGKGAVAVVKGGIKVAKTTAGLLLPPFSAWKKKPPQLKATAAVLYEMDPIRNPKARKVTAEAMCSVIAGIGTGFALSWAVANWSPAVRAFLDAFSMLEWAERGRKFIYEPAKLKGAF